MFKYIREHLQSADNLAIYPIISLIIFFLFFMGLLYYVKKLDKNRVNEISKIPLDSGDDNLEPASPTH
jgi:cytochrome c oxidase cbb3-type subunit IV